jgi:ABC-type uncharacterized transport system substrate-binding protein
MHFDQLRRRDFIMLMGGGVAAWPLAARAQQTRRIGVMIALPESDPELKKWLAAFRQALERLGWSESRNVHFDYRFTPAGAHAHESAKELLALQPDVILAFSTPVTAAFQQETRTVPIVFMGIADAVGQELGIEPVLTPIENDAADIERAITTFAHAAPKGGLVIPGDSTTNAHRDLIVR